MPTTFSALKSAEPSDYFSCAQQWATFVTDFDNDIVQYQQSVIAPVNNGSWTGSAAGVAKKSVQDSFTKITTTRAYVDGVRALLQAAGDGVTRAKRRLLQGIVLAASAGIPVDDNGRITPDIAMTTPITDWNNPPILAGMAAQNMIYQALYMADSLNAIIDPQLNYATKLSPTETGPWLTDADTDHQNALSASTNVKDTLDGIAVDPPPWRDVLAQPYNVEQGNPGDWARYQLLSNVGVPFLLTKGVHASLAFSHFLDNTGTPLPINPAHVINDVPVFAQTVLNALATQGSYALDSGWTNTNVEDPNTGIAQNEDWYYTMNDFRYRVVGRGYVAGDQQVVDYSVGILKPYEFGDSVLPDGTVLHRKPLHLPGGATMDQKDIERLHTVGMAQNFIIQGVTHFRASYSLTSGTFNPTTTVTESDPWPTL